MISADEWLARGQQLELLGHKIFYVDEAARSEPRGTILLIHGFPTSSWDWWKVWQQLNRHYRLIAMDLLGFGFSAKPSPHDYRIMEQADLCEALADSLGLEQFHVLAHDYGDTVAQEMLARQNEELGVGKWQSCMFLNGGLFPETHRAVLAQKLLKSPVGFIFRHALTAKSLNKSFDHIFGETKASQEELDTFFELFDRDGGRRNVHRLIHYMSDRLEHRERWVRALSQASCPIGLINGNLDPVSGSHMVERFQELVEGEHFIHHLPTVGHYPQVEAPDDVASAYELFLAGL
ncbi:alpha/beta hydrolase [Congregibacter brevis]|uniref:Alpha/beta hydrolase n=1 Tax=Congregibacter brevis TaxID=3081201 RepID=A0ABZ0IFK3_9GAMM|nr:alpha/beta hydrolase [Congregibacter sp. IMCC45268]